MRKPSKAMATLVLAGLAMALPIVLVRFPPMADLAPHGVVARTMRELLAHQAGYEVYRINLGHPNAFIYVLMGLLSLALPYRIAASLTAALAVFLLPVAAARALVAFRKSPWPALLIAPLGLGWLFFWGLISNLWGLVALLFFLPLFDRFSTRPLSRSVAQVIGALGVLYFVHEISLAVALVYIVVVGVTVRPRQSAWSLRMAPIATILALAAAQLVIQVRGRAPIQADARFSMGGDVGARLVSVPAYLFSRLTDVTRNGLFVFWLIALLFVAWESIRAAVHHWGKSSLRARLRTHRHAFVTTLLFVGYFTFPDALNGASHLYHRALGLAVVFLVLATSPSPQHLHRLGPFVLALLPVAQLLCVLPDFAASHRQYKEVDRIASRIPEHSRILSRYIGRADIEGFVGPVDTYIALTRGGFSNNGFLASPTSPATLRPECRRDEFEARLARAPFELMPARDLAHIQYIVFQFSDEYVARSLTRFLAKEARLVGHTANYWLYESLVPPKPPCESDEAAPNTDTLGARMMRREAKNSADPAEKERWIQLLRSMDAPTL